MGRRTPRWWTQGNGRASVGTDGGSDDVWLTLWILTVRCRCRLGCGSRRVRAGPGTGGGDEAGAGRSSDGEKGGCGYGIEEYQGRQEPYCCMLAMALATTEKGIARLDTAMAPICLLHWRTLCPLRSSGSAIFLHTRSYLAAKASLGVKLALAAARATHLSDVRRARRQRPGAVSNVMTDNEIPSRMMRSRHHMYIFYSSVTAQRCPFK